MIFNLKLFAVAFCAGTMMMPFSCQQADSYEIKISGPTSVGNEWLEIHPESPLKAKKTYQYVYLVLEPPFKDDFYEKGRGPNKGKGILMPDGEVINPEVDIVDQYGNTFNFIYGGSIGLKPKYALPYPKELPRDRTY